ncbi:MAG: hypothetical protein ACFE8U_01000 [Candidatus Hermodarchaeota archaeon]
MADTDFNPVVWVSLASTAGLSLISLGQPGLRSDLDEQVYTGGLTAVQQMLSGEVGGDTTRFVGGSHSNKTGRFLVKGSESELVGQFLLISPENLPVDPTLIDYYEHLVSIFAQETLKTDHYRRVQEFYMSLGVNDVLDTFLYSIKQARKKVSIPHNENLFSTALHNTLLKSINEYEYSVTLVKVSEFKGKYTDLKERMNSEKKALMADFETDILEFLASEYPHALVMFPKIDSLEKTLSKSLNSEMAKINVKNHLEELIQEFETNELSQFLEEFSLHEITKVNLRSNFEDEIFHKFKREYPLLYLIDPNINGFPEIIDSFTRRINEQYDLAGTLTRIGKAILGEGRELEERLVLPYITNFCNQFSAGLTSSAWKYMQIVFKLITLESNIDVTDILPNFKDQIPEKHFSDVETNMTKYKLAKLAPISFTIKKASDALPFYRALFSTIGFGVNSIICDLALNDKTTENFFWHTAHNLNDFIRIIYHTYALFSIYIYLERNQSRMNFTISYPSKDSFEKSQEDIAKDPLIICEALIKANIDGLRKENQLVERKFEEFQQAFSKRINEIENYLSQDPKRISTGYSFKRLNELEILSLSFKPLKSVDEIIEKVQTDYEKLITEIYPDLDRVKDAAVQFQNGKIDKKKLEKILENRGFLNKIRSNFEKMIRKAQDDINKKYRDSPSIVEKEFKGRSKDIFKEYNQACSFLNFDRKGLRKGESNLIPDPSSTISNLQASINQKFTKERFLNRENLGIYYFHARYRTLPKNLENEISNSLVQRKSYPLLKESIEYQKKDLSIDIFRSYSIVLEEYAKDFINSLFEDADKIFGKNILKRDMDVFFSEKDKITIPTLELGLVSSAEAANSLKTLLGSAVIVHEEKGEDNIQDKIYRISAAIPNFEADVKQLKNIWKSKDWTLKKVILLLSWYSLLAKNSFYVNLIRYATDLYSDRVKNSLEKIFADIGKEIIKN